jgi:large subunit ribosomal protein LP0
MRANKLDDCKDAKDFEALRQFGSNGISELNVLIEKCRGKIGYIFTDTPAFELKPIIESNRVKTDAKVGMIAQCDVVVPPGPTGLDPN